MFKSKLKIVTNTLIAIIITIVYIVAFLPSNSITISGNGNFMLYYHGKKQSDKVSLMFNVYENTEIVNKIIDVLDKNNVKATFFVGGCWADDNIKTLNKIILSGHELGNHGYFHKDHKKINEEENYAEINNCGKIVNSLTGYKMELFAPPSGSYSKATLKVAESLGYKTIMWSRDTIDWRDSDKKLIVKRATLKTEGGDFVLMHPKQHTLDSLQEIITTLKNKNFVLTTVSENISSKDKL